MSQDNTGLDYLQVEHPLSNDAIQKPFAELQNTVTENATESEAADPSPAPRDRSSSDAPKAQINTGQTDSFGNQSLKQKKFYRTLPSSTWFANPAVSRHPPPQITRRT